MIDLYEAIALQSIEDDNFYICDFCKEQCRANHIKESDVGVDYWESDCCGDSFTKK